VTVQLEASVVIPARNAGATISAQLEALSAQRGASVSEVIVVDNGSTDGTRKVVATEASRLGVVCKVVRAAGKVGPSFARNVGVRFAAADQLLFCGADDRVARGWVQGLVDSLVSAHLVGGPLSRDQRWPQLRFGAPFVAGGSMEVAKEALASLGGFDESLTVAEDLDLCLRAATKGRRFGYAPTAGIERGARPGIVALCLQSYRYGYWVEAVAARYAAPLKLRMPPWGALARGALWLVVRIPNLGLSRFRRRLWVRQSGLLIGGALGRLRAWGSLRRNRSGSFAKLGGTQ